MIAKETGWTLEYIGNQPFALLNAMMADAPRLTDRKKSRKFNSDEELVAWMNKK